MRLHNAQVTLPNQGDGGTDGRRDRSWVAQLPSWAIFQDKVKEQHATRKQIKLIYKGLFCTKVRSLI